MRNILFLCTANSARSILAEAILNARGHGRFAAYSAGSFPRGVPNPIALELLRSRGHSVDGLRSKSWNEFSGPSAIPMHAVITVCDNAKGESCPIMPGHPMQVHWGIPDPAGHGHDGAIEDFALAYDRLVHRIDELLALGESALNQHEWRSALMVIGQESEGATGHA